MFAFFIIFGKRITDMRTKISAIYQGWKNVVFKTPEIEELAKKRANICAQCKHIKIFNTKGQILTSQDLAKLVESEIIGAKCGQCGCFLSAKTRQNLEKCPFNFWEDIELFEKNGKQN